MKYLLDTDALSEPAKRGPSETVVAKLREHSHELAMSVVSVGEIVFGARRVAGGQRYLDYLSEVVLPRVPVLAMDVAVAIRYGELRAVLENEGQPLADLDLLIAATALENNLTLVSGNLRHFRRVPGLQLANWFGR